MDAPAAIDVVGRRVSPLLGLISQSSPSKSPIPLRTFCLRGTNPAMFEQVKLWAKSLKRDVVALWIAARSPRTPLGAKVVAGVVAAYALSPIDLIPDFIPILGYLDDVLIVPLGVALAVRMIPAALMEDFRAEAVLTDRPTNRYVAAVIVGLWLLGVTLVAIWVDTKFR